MQLNIMSSITECKKGTLKSLPMFATRTKGKMAGAHLVAPAGKNKGLLKGNLYFQCKPVTFQCCIA